MCICKVPEITLLICSTSLSPGGGSWRSSKTLTEVHVLRMLPLMLLLPSLPPPLPLPLLLLLLFSFSMRCVSVLYWKLFLLKQTTAANIQKVLEGRLVLKSTTAANIQKALGGRERRREVEERGEGGCVICMCVCTGSAHSCKYLWLTGVTM